MLLSFDFMSMIFKTHVSQFINQNPICKNCSTDLLLQGFFTSTSNAANLFYVFHYFSVWAILHKKYVPSIFNCHRNFSHWSQKLRRCKNINEGKNESVVRKVLLAFYDFLPLAPDFANVTRVEFYEIQERSRNEQGRMFKMEEASYV